MHRQLDHELEVHPSAIWATNFAQPYVHHVTDTWTITAKVPLRLLGIRENLVDPALEHVGHSPLAPLFSHHLAHVRQVADGVNGAAADSLGTATLALARALFTSVSGDDALGREALDDTLLLRVKAYIREHLADTDLGPTTIAAANHVSVRQLYRACAQADLQLEQWIIGQRLERAREDLARPAPTPLPVSKFAHRWGFASASHFARRFRGAYDMSPREWQALNRPAPHGDGRAD